MYRTLTLGAASEVHLKCHIALVLMIRADAKLLPSAVRLVSIKGTEPLPMRGRRAEAEIQRVRTKT